MRQPIEVFLTAKAQESATSQSFVCGFKNAEGSDPAEILIDGEIGDRWEQNDARNMGQFLRANKSKAVKVWINSPGGLAYDGITMHNALAAHDGHVTTIIAGMAGSAASIIAMAGDTVQMYENASLFIHRASLIAVGNVDVMAEAQDWLNKIDDAIAKTYKARTGAALDKIKAQMRGRVDGTVFSAKEALSGKWIDQIVSLKKDKPAVNVVDLAPGLRKEAEARFGKLDSMRAERIRSRREMFVPAE